MFNLYNIAFVQPNYVHFRVEWRLLAQKIYLRSKELVNLILFPASLFYSKFVFFVTLNGGNLWKAILEYLFKVILGCSDWIGMSLKNVTAGYFCLVPNEWGFQKLFVRCNEVHHLSLSFSFHDAEIVFISMVVSVLRLKVRAWVIANQP